MSDKLISLESVLKEIRRFKGYIDDDMIERFTIAFKRLPTVPHEMTAREYHLIKRRMCKNCPVCPLNEAAINLFIDCKRFEREFPNEAVAIVEKWAREHPEERSEG